MTPETLERLLLDRALGILPPDTDELLAAYLSRDATAASRGREYAAVTAGARQVLRGDPAAALPPFPVARIGQARRTQRSLRMVRSVAGLAAAVLCGVGVGTWGLSRTTDEVRPASSPAVQYASAKSAVPDAAASFWSAARLCAAAQVAKPAGPGRLVWYSPISKPEWRGEL
jgi:hypothetical protein